MTFVIRGSSPEVRGEVKRAFDDALGVAHRLKRHPSDVARRGGESRPSCQAPAYICILVNLAESNLAIEAYAAALEIIPRVLAENCWHGPHRYCHLIIVSGTK